MANENDELEKAVLNRLAGLASVTWPFDDLPDKLNPGAAQSYQTVTHLPSENQIMAIGDGATTRMGGFFQVDFFQAHNQDPVALTQRVDLVSNAFWANRRSVDLAAGPYIVRFPRKPSMRLGVNSPTHRTRALDIYYSMRSAEL